MFVANFKINNEPKVQIIEASTIEEAKDIFGLYLQQQLKTNPELSSISSIDIQPVLTKHSVTGNTKIKPLKELDIEDNTQFLFS